MEHRCINCNAVCSESELFAINTMLDDMYLCNMCLDELRLTAEEE